MGRGQIQTGFSDLCRGLEGAQKQHGIESNRFLAPGEGEKLFAEIEQKWKLRPPREHQPQSVVRQLRCSKTKLAANYDIDDVTTECCKCDPRYLVFRGSYPKRLL
jgi:hypothetical protein